MKRSSFSSLRILWLSMVLLCLAPLAACQDEGYSGVHYEAVDVDSWDATERVEFSLGPVPSAGTYDVRLLLRMSSAQPYPFKSLFLEVRQQWGTDTVAQVDTVECHFAQTVMETEGINLHQYEYAVSAHTCLEPDSVRFTLRHLMRKEEIPGVADVGIALIPAER